MLGLLLLLLWVCTSAAGLPGAGTAPDCGSAHAFMSAGDYNLTRENFEALLRREKHLLVAVTSSRGCETCCGFERVVASVVSGYFANASSAYFEKHVKVGRVDVAESEWFRELHPDARHVPNWLMYVDGRAYYLSKQHVASRFVQQVGRLVEPFTQVRSLAGFEQLLGFEKRDVSGRHLVRNKVVGLFADPEEYEGHVANFRRLALDSHAREDTVFGLCTSREVVRAVHRKFGARFLPNPYDLNGVFFLRMKNRFAASEALALMDFAADRSLERWLARASISPLEEMTALNQHSFSTATPLLVAFVDPRRERETGAFLAKLEALGRKYLTRVNFVWVDFRDNLLLMIRLGLEGHRLPCVGLESPHGLEQAYRLEGSHEDLHSLDRFLEAFLAGRLSQNLRAQIDADLELSEQSLALLADTQPLDYLDLDALLADPALDAAVYFHNSSLASETHRAASRMFNTLAKVAKQHLRLHSAVFASYDFGRNRLPEDFFNDPEFAPGAVYVLPASQKRGPFLRWRASGSQRTGSGLLRFLAEHADQKFSPELPAAGLTAAELQELGEPAEAAELEL